MSIKNFLLICLIGLLCYLCCLFKADNQNEVSACAKSNLNSNINNKIGVVNSDPIIQSYNNDRYFLVRNCQNLPLHIYNASGVEIVNYMQIPDTHFEFAVNKNEKKVTIATSVFKKTFHITGNGCYLPPKYKY